MKKQYTVILYSYFGKARVRQDFAGMLRQVASVRILESIKSALCARVRRPKTSPRRVSMNQDVFNVQTRRFLNKVGIQSQREIERAMHQYIKSGPLRSDEKLFAEVLF